MTSWSRVCSGVWRWYSTTRGLAGTEEQGGVLVFGPTVVFQPEAGIQMKPERVEETVVRRCRQS